MREEEVKKKDVKRAKRREEGDGNGPKCVCV